MDKIIPDLGFVCNFISVTFSHDDYYMYIHYNDLLKKDQFFFRKKWSLEDFNYYGHLSSMIASM